jgi:hypothetical protein
LKVTFENKSICHKRHKLDPVLAPRLEARVVPLVNEQRVIYLLCGLIRIQRDLRIQTSPILMVRMGKQPWNGW